MQRGRADRSAKGGVLRLPRGARACVSGGARERRHARIVMMMMVTMMMVMMMMVMTVMMVMMVMMMMFFVSPSRVAVAAVRLAALVLTILGHAFCTSFRA